MYSLFEDTYDIDIRDIVIIVQVLVQFVRDFPSSVSGIVIACKLDCKAKEMEAMQLYCVKEVSNSIVSKASSFQCTFEWSKFW